MLRLLRVLFAFLSLAVICASLARAEDVSPIPQVADQWRFSVTPYAWLPSINSTLSYKNRYIDTAHVTTNNIISNLKSGGMIAGEAHYGNWGIMGDIVSATLQKDGSFPVSPAPGMVVSVSDKATVQATIVTGAATYTFLNNQDAYVDGLLGVRWVGMTATLGLAASFGGPLQQVVDSKAMSTADPIVGFKGRYRIADSTWYIPFYADIGSGGGTTNLTWQAMLGVGTTINKWIDVSLVYRNLYYDMDSSKTNGAGLLQKTTFQGPQLSATFNF